MGAGGIAEEDIERLTLLLFRQRPGAIQRLTQWMKKWGGESNEEVLESFERICKKAREAGRQDLP